jgi:hypothetical protein
MAGSEATSRGAGRCSTMWWQASMAATSTALKATAPSPVATHFIARTIASACGSLLQFDTRQAA